MSVSFFVGQLVCVFIGRIMQKVEGWDIGRGTTHSILARIPRKGQIKDFHNLKHYEIGLVCFSFFVTF